jgi:hypothetical protein
MNPPLRPSRHSHSTDPADPREHRPPEHVEAHHIAHRNAESFDDALFDRDFGKLVRRSDVRARKRVWPC